MGRHSDDRFYNVVVKAEASKRIRECILRMVPPGLRSELVLCVDEQLDAFLDDSTVDKIVAEFSKRAVTLEMIERLLGKRRDSFTNDDRASLLGVWNAIKDGETTIAEAFGDEDRTNVTDAEIEAGLRKKPEAPTTESEAAMAVQAPMPPESARTAPEPPGPPPAAKKAADAAPASPAASERAIGRGSDLYRSITTAYGKLGDADRREQIRRQLGINMVTDIAKYSALDANDALKAIEAKLAETAT